MILTKKDFINYCKQFGLKNYSGKNYIEIYKYLIANLTLQNARILAKDFKIFRRSLLKKDELINKIKIDIKSFRLRKPESLQTKFNKSKKIAKEVDESVAKTQEKYDELMKEVEEERFILLERAYNNTVRSYTDGFLIKDTTKESTKVRFEEAARIGHELLFLDEEGEKNERYSIDMYLINLEKAINTLISRLSDEMKSIKFYLVLKISVFKVDMDKDKKVFVKYGKIIKGTKVIISNNMEMVDINLMLNEIKDSITSDDNVGGEFKVEEKKKAVGSGFRFFRFSKTYVNVIQFKPLEGGSYIKLPDFIRNKGCIVNVQNKDEECFKWAFLSAKHPQKTHVDRVGPLKQYEKNYNFDGIEFPTSIKSVKKFAKQNNERINVYMLEVIKKMDKKTNKMGEGHNMYPLLVDENPEKALNLIIYKNHYMNLKNLNGLMRGSKRQQHLCLRCLNNCANEKTLQKHIEYCKTQEVAKVELPEEGSKMEFTKFQNKLKAPFVIYADFESDIVKVPVVDEVEEVDKVDKKKKKIKRTVYMDNHVAISFALKVVSEFDEYKFPLSNYRGENAIDEFLKCLIDHGDRIAEIKSQEKEIIMTEEDKLDYEVSDRCHICDKIFSDKKRTLESLTQEQQDYYKLIMNDPKKVFILNFMKYYKRFINVVDCNKIGSKYYLEKNAFDNLKSDVEIFFNDIVIDDKYSEIYKKAWLARVCGKGNFKNNYEIYIKYIKEVYNQVIGKCDDITFCDKINPILKKLDREADPKVRDHCHITGKYRGAAHMTCNLKYRNKSFIPVIFHNLKGYDSHLILQKIGKHFEDKKMDIIAKTDEKYMSFRVGMFKFIDSYAFLDRPLEYLASLLDKKTEFKILESEMNDKLKPNQIEILKNKGIYPYEYNEPNKYNLGFPEKNNFFSKLSNSHISDEDYKQATDNYINLECKNFGDYHDYYLKTDVLLLADVFEKFRNISIVDYGLEPCNYVSLPSYAWDACLKMTEATPALLSDLSMVELFEDGRRGGVSLIASSRHEVANNKYMSNFDKNKESSFIWYGDANNLYGGCMMQKLPYSDFQWISEKNLTLDKLKELTFDDWGFTVVVDIDYPEELHDLHNDFPLLPEKLCVSNDMLSDYQLKTKMKLHSHMSKGEQKISEATVKKLVPTLNNKRQYTIHSEALYYALKKGLKLVKIHRGVMYREKTWMKSYIEFNSNKRAKSKNDFEKDFYKLMNNAVYGKTMENVRNYQDAILCTGSKRLEKLSRDPRIKGWTIFNNDLVLFNRYKKVVKLNKPIYTGFAILELSKIHMQKFHYDYIKKKYGNKATLLFTDTDSLTYHIKTDDLYADFYKDRKAHFDMANYSEDFKLLDGSNTKIKDTCNDKVVLKFKDETAGVPIKEFIGHRSKLYSILLDNNKSKSTAKGVKQCIKSQDMTHDVYKNILLNNEKLEVKQCTLKSEKHNIYTIETTKVAASSFDDKRYILDDGIRSLSHGHRLIKEFKNKK